MLRTAIFQLLFVSLHMDFTVSLHHASILLRYFIDINVPWIFIFRPQLVQARNVTIQVKIQCGKLLRFKCNCFFVLLFVFICTHNIGYPTCAPLVPSAGFRDTA
jgi:hypothetical protein